MRCIILLTALSAVANAETTAAGPLSGYIYISNSRTLHALHGVPGSAYVGPAIADNLDNAWPAPAGAIAIAERAGQTFVLRRLNHPEPAVEAGAGLLNSPSMVVWSRTGKAAVLLGQGQVQVLHVDGGISADTPIEAAFLGNVSAIATDDSGRVAIASAGGVYILSAGGLTLLHDAGDVHKLRFGAGNLLYAAGPDRLLRIDTNSHAATVLVQGAAISAFAVLHKTNALCLADFDRRVLDVYDSSGKKTETIALDRAPSTMDALVYDSLFLLNTPGIEGSPAIVLQLSAQSSVLFVPLDLNTL